MCNQTISDCFVTIYQLLLLNIIGVLNHRFRKTRDRVINS